MENQSRQIRELFSKLDPRISAVVKLPNRRIIVFESGINEKIKKMNEKLSKKFQGIPGITANLKKTAELLVIKNYDFNYLQKKLAKSESENSLI